jgi:hypothetical protein
MGMMLTKRLRRVSEIVHSDIELQKASSQTEFIVQLFQARGGDLHII